MYSYPAILLKSNTFNCETRIAFTFTFLIDWIHQDEDGCWIDNI